MWYIHPVQYFSGVITVSKWPNKPEGKDSSSSVKGYFPSPVLLWNAGGVCFLAECFLMETMWGGGGGAGKWSLEEWLVFPICSSTPHCEYSENNPGHSCFGFASCRFTVLSAQAGGSIAEACLDQGAPETEPVISLLLWKASLHSLEPWGFTPTWLESKSQALSDFGIGCSFVMTLQNKTQREETEGHSLCCSNSLIS